MASTRPLDPQTLFEFNAWIRADGAPAVAIALGTSIATVQRTNAGAPCLPLTRAAIGRALATRGAVAS